MNNKGQTLILFIFLLPIIFMVIALIINYSILSNEKLKLENNIKDAIEYGLKIKAEDTLSNDEIENRLKKLLDQNIDYETLNILVDETNIIVTLTKTNSGFINILTNFNKTLELSYCGRIVNGNIEIERR